MPNSAFDQAVAVCLSSINDVQAGVLSHTNTQWRPMDEVTGNHCLLRGPVQQIPQCISVSRYNIARLKTPATHETKCRCFQIWMCHLLITCNVGR